MNEPLDSQRRDVPQARRSSAASPREKEISDIEAIDATHEKAEDQRQIISGERITATFDTTVVGDNASQLMSQLLDPDVPSSMTIEESWAENPFPSLENNVNLIEPSSSANHKATPRAPADLVLNEFPSCTQSSVTQTDSDDDDPFPVLPISSGNLTLGLSDRRQSASPKPRTNEIARPSSQTTSFGHSMPDIGSVDDVNAMSVFTTRRVMPALRQLVLSRSDHLAASNGDRVMEQCPLSVVHDFLSIFEDD